MSLKRVIQSGADGGGQHVGKGVGHGGHGGHGGGGNGGPCPNTEGAGALEGKTASGESGAFQLPATKCDRATASSEELTKAGK